jgi:hypothetical protein
MLDCASVLRLNLVRGLSAGQVQFRVQRRGLIDDTLAVGSRPQRAWAAEGQKRSTSSLGNRVQINAEGSQTRMNRAIARQSSPIVVSVEQACHAGGRGFESRRSRSRSRHFRATRGWLRASLASVFASSAPRRHTVAGLGASRESEP